MKKINDTFKYLLGSFKESFVQDGICGALIRTKNFIVHGKGKLKVSEINKIPRQNFDKKVKMIRTAQYKKINTVSNNEKPEASIIIPVYNHIEHTLDCLKSIAYASDYTKIEVIVVDDGSYDATGEILNTRQDIVYIKNTQNIGFVSSCNHGAEHARGEYIFLNNDTLVTDNWIDSSIDLLKNNSSIGLVGSKLIYPNGVLQEAGGIIWSDGSGCNYGRGDDPQRATYNFVREVDYCSGAAILIKRALFLEIGKFDSRYSPAYYEDTDLAFAVRKKGLRVIYNPFSEVVHCEGVTAGTDLTQGVKSYQVKNQVSFVAKWKKELALQGAPYTYPLHLDATRYAKKRILVLDHQTPRPDHDSGSVDMFNLLKIMNGFGYQVTFIPILDRRYFPGYIENLQKIGIECICEGFGVDPDRFIQEMGGEFDVVVISRVTVAREYIDKVTAFCSNAKIIFNTVDLHYLREERQASIGNNSFIQESAIELKKVELDSIRRADITIVVSQVEADILKKEVPTARVVVIPIIRTISDYQKPVPDVQNPNMVFIGGFFHAPNVDAVIWFTQKILPFIRKKNPKVVFNIIGPNAPTKITSLANGHVIVHGHVSDADTLIRKALVTVAPLRFGAGQKGKIIQSLSLGVPCVATTLAIESMGLVPGRDILVADTEEEFALAVLEVLKNEELRNSLSKNGYQAVKKEFNIVRTSERIAQLFKDIEDIQKDD